VTAGLTTPIPPTNLWRKYERLHSLLFQSSIIDHSRSRIPSRQTQRLTITMSSFFLAVLVFITTAHPLLVSSHAVDTPGLRGLQVDSVVRKCVVIDPSSTNYSKVLYFESHSLCELTLTRYCVLSERPRDSHHWWRGCGRT
jgi:hypothetical protein